VLWTSVPKAPANVYRDPRLRKYDVHAPLRTGNNLLVQSIAKAKGMQMLAQVNFGFRVLDAL
jgi:hypothetical protein